MAPARRRRSGARYPSGTSAGRVPADTRVPSVGRTAGALAGDELAANSELACPPSTRGGDRRWRPEMATRDGCLQALEIAGFMTWMATWTATRPRLAARGATDVLVEQEAPGVSRADRVEDTCVWACWVGRSAEHLGFLGRARSFRLPRASAVLTDDETSYELQVRVLQNVRFHFECGRPHSTFTSRTRKWALRLRLRMQVGSQQVRRAGAWTGPAASAGSNPREFRALSLASCAGESPRESEAQQPGQRIDVEALCPLREQGRPSRRWSYGRGWHRSMAASKSAVATSPEGSGRSSTIAALIQRPNEHGSDQVGARPSGAV